MIERMMNVDRRVIYLLLFLALSIPLIRPVGLPLSISRDTQNLYDVIDKLPAGSRVLMSIDTSPGGYGELMPGAVAIINHLMARGAKLYVSAFFDAGPSLFESSVNTTALKNKQYGTDYVNLGYRAGGENGISAFATDIPKTFPKCFRGQDTASMPIMQGIKSARDLNLIITVSSGTPGTAEWVRQVRDAMGTPLASMVVAVNVPTITPYLQSKQVVGLVAGLRGAAEYEKLIKAPGLGAAGMDAQSFSHLLILVLVILGNAGYLISERRKTEGR